MNDYSELKKLAEAAAPGPWTWVNENLCSPQIEEPGAVIRSEPHEGMWFGDYSNPTRDETNKAFIAAANPAAVLALISDLEVSNNVGRALGETLGSVVESRDALVRVVDQLKAENEKLTNVYASAGEREHELRTELALLLKDAERFAYVVTEQAIVEKSKNGPRFWLVFPNGDTQAGVFDSPSEAIDDMMSVGIAGV